MYLNRRKHYRINEKNAIIEEKNKIKFLLALFFFGEHSYTSNHPTPTKWKKKSPILLFSFKCRLFLHSDSFFAFLSIPASSLKLKLCWWKHNKRLRYGLWPQPLCTSCAQLSDGRDLSVHLQLCRWQRNSGRNGALETQQLLSDTKVNAIENSKD